MSKVNRREFVRISSLVAAGTVAAACAGPAATPAPVAPAPAQPTTAPVVPAGPTAVPTARPSSPPTAVPQPTVEVSRYNEAPQLAELVAQGQLPPVEERLPLKPSVCPVLETTGKYGGSLRRGFNGMADSVGPDKMVSSHLVFYNPDLSLRPDVSEGWEINEDASVWTFHLREGMKWSDGSPFTSADLQWWYENDLLNTTLRPSVPAAWQAGPERTVMVLESPDDYTVTFSFVAPNPLFAYQLAMSAPWVPSEYMTEWHMETATDTAALEAQISERGFETWNDVYATMGNWRLNPDLPQLGPWVSQNTLQDELFVCERNPYFWQIDADGNQLPYIDRLTHRLFGSPDVFNMWILGGEIDFQGRHVSLANYVLFKEGEQRGDYWVLNASNDATLALCVNQTVKEPRLREFFQNRNVRKALSFAINREEINEIIYDGLSIPRQYSPPTGSPQFYEKLTTAYIDYDPALANEMLDAEGYEARGSDGYRLYKDGSGPISFIIETNEAVGDVVEMLSQYYDAVGVKATLALLERSLVEQHCASNEIDVRITLCSRAVLPIVDPAFFIGTAGDKSYGYAWSHWYNNPTNPNAEEPPDDGFAKKLWQIWADIRVEPDMSKHTEMFFQILDILYDELPLIGITGEEPAPVIVKNGLRNIFKGFSYPWSNPIRHDGFVQLQSYFWDEPEKH